jgi:hypothetical protein
VQTPENLQNYNRYSYVLNNPVSYADPSGYFFVSLLAGALLMKAGVGPVVIGAVMFVAGFADALIMGASPSEAFKSGLLAAAAAVVAYNVGNFFNNQYEGFADLDMSFSDAVSKGKISLKPTIELARASTHGLTQGGLSEVAGGDFGSGFLGGLSGSVAGSIMQTESFAGHSFFGSFQGQLASSAVVGGTVAEIGGGKFANGAISAAFVQLFNHASDRAQGNKRVGFSSMDEAGVSASMEAHQLTAMDSENFEYGGEIYSYMDENGNTKYGYVTPRRGRAPTSIEANEGARGAFSPITDGSNLPDGASLVAHFHSHPSNTSFSGIVYSNGQMIGGDEAFVRHRSKLPFYLGRGNLQGRPFRTKVEVMTLNGKGGVDKTMLFDSKKGWVN